MLRLLLLLPLLSLSLACCCCSFFPFLSFAALSHACCAAKWCPVFTTHYGCGLSYYKLCVSFFVPLWLLIFLLIIFITDFYFYLRAQLNAQQIHFIGRRWWWWPWLRCVSVISLRLTVPHIVMHCIPHTPSSTCRHIVRTVSTLMHLYLTTNNKLDNSFAKLCSQFMR